MDEPRSPKKRPDPLFALQHYSFLAMVQCRRLREAGLAIDRVADLPMFDATHVEAKHLFLGERFFLLCAGREMVRAIDKLRLGKLPGAMHQDLEDFRDALSHWDGWGKGKRAETRIHQTYPDSWPYEVRVLHGEVHIGGSLKVSELEQAAERLYLWTRDPSHGHGLVVPEDRHTHEVMIRFDRAQFFPMVRALERAEFDVGGGNDFLVVRLTDPARVKTVQRVARRVDPQVVVEDMGPKRDPDDELIRNEQPL